MREWRMEFRGGRFWRVRQERPWEQRALGLGSDAR